MKKLSILIALILVVTIGGVYATWHYNETSVNEVSWDLTPNLQSYIGSSTAEGNLKVMPSPMPTIMVVDNLDAEGNPVGEQEGGDHVAELAFNGYMVVTFAPFDSNTSPTALDLTYNLSVKNASFTDTTEENAVAKEIFTVDTGAKNLPASGAIKLEDADDITNAQSTYGVTFTEADLGKWYYVLTAEMLDEVVDLNGEFKLETLTDYHAFQEALKSVTFTIEVNKAETA
ncbi:MAG: hypothetical protein IJW44_01330 [Clostridia bacterium]|nr:hypothetical protein [Clostridia bacterium]